MAIWLPEIVTICSALMLFVIFPFVKNQRAHHLISFAVSAFVCVVMAWQKRSPLLYLTLGVISLIWHKEGNRFTHKIETFPLLLLIISGVSIVVTSLTSSDANYITVYLGIELQSICIYIILALNLIKENKKTDIEAILRYFLFGSLASGLLITGISYLYVTTGSFAIYHDGIAPAGDNAITLAFALISAGIILKLALAPLHFWLPSIYQIADYRLLILLSAAPKFSELLIAYTIPASFIIIFLAAAMVSVVFGSIFMLRQKKISRFFAYSTIANIGYIAVAQGAIIFTGGKVEVQSTVFYLIIYMLTTAMFFCIIMMAENNIERPLLISDLSGIGKKYPLAAFLLTVALLSYSGLPPFAGFFIKYQLIKDLLAKCDLWYYPAVILIIGTVLPCFSYLNISKTMYIAEWENMVISYDKTLLSIAIFIAFLLTFGLINTGAALIAGAICIIFGWFAFKPTKAFQ